VVSPVAVKQGAADFRGFHGNENKTWRVEALAGAKHMLYTNQRFAAEGRRIIGSHALQSSLPTCVPVACAAAAETGRGLRGRWRSQS